MPEIIVALATRRPTSAALDWAANLADHGGFSLVAVCAAEPPPEVAQVLAGRPGPPVPVEVLDDDPDAALAERSERDDVAFVVVDQHTSPDFGGVATAHHLIHHVHHPVVVVGEGEAHPAGPVVVGVDGSPTNAEALEVAERLAAAMERPVLAVYCPDPMTETFPRPEGWQFPHERDVRREVGPALREDTELLIEPGHPTETLARVAAERDATAVVVGTRGRGGFHALVAGRVPVQLLQHACTPLVVVPHPRD